MVILYHGSMSSQNSAKQISISEFKAKCLSLLDETGRTGKEYLVTRNGKPLAKVIPIQKKSQTSRGSLAGLVKLHGDIVSVDFSEDWDVLK